MTIDLEAARKRAREAQERADKATPGPWYHCEANEGHCPCESVFVEGDGGLGVLSAAVAEEHGCFDAEQISNNLRFAAAARSDVPALATLVTDTAAEIERLRADTTRALLGTQQAINAREDAVRALLDETAHHNGIVADLKNEIERLKKIEAAARSLCAQFYAGRETIPFAEANALQDALR